MMPRSHSCRVASTAYALSAGGSIIHPELNLWNIIPMMSQSLSSRPLIVSNEKTLEIQLIQGPLDHAMVCVDGQQDIPIKYNESILIRALLGKTLPSKTKGC